MTYEENVRETAHQMVLSMYNTIVALPSTISMFDRAARRVVDSKAEGFTDAWNLTNSYLPGSEKELNRLLIERGLIPAPEVCQECGKNIGEKCERYTGSNCTFQD